MNNSWFLDINHFARSTPWLHAFFTAYAEYGIGLFAVLMLIAWWVSRREMDRVMAAVLLTPIVAVFSFIINQPISSHFKHPRPFTIWPNVLVLVTKTHDWSFPSDHAVASGAITVALFYVSRKLGLVASALALVMAFARVYVGVHFPMDVVVGLLEGGLIAGLFSFLFSATLTRWVHVLRRNRLTGILLSDR
ncbi:MAG TPA: phosphatase PAP2 family protein [Candidatus Nanopelagicaceae bacterium]|nr:phosphatase PAP2 family protein [Candidatus Nanopelagicaceae bacterium]